MNSDAGIIVSAVPRMKFAAGTVARDATGASVVPTRALSVIISTTTVWDRAWPAARIRTVWR